MSEVWERGRERMRERRERKIKIERGERGGREREMVRERERKTKIGRKNSIPLGNNKTFKRKKQQESNGQGNNGPQEKQWPIKISKV